MNTCSKCGVEKNLDGFLVRKDRKCGIHRICKECTNENRRSYYNANITRVRDRQKKYYKANRKKYIRSAKEWFDKRDPEQKEERKKYLKAWYKKNREAQIEKRKEQKERINLWQKEYNKKRDQKKADAYKIYVAAVRRGDLIRPKACSICGSEKYPIQGHHMDYSNPLEVVWVCTFCHSALHKSLKERKE